MQEQRIHIQETQVGAQAPEYARTPEYRGGTPDTPQSAVAKVTEPVKEQFAAAKEQVSGRAGQAAGDVREQLRARAEDQQGRWAGRLRQSADELKAMADGRDESPTTTIVSGLAARARTLADRVENRSPENLLQEVQDYARRRPGTFLLAAVAAGFIAGRVGKSLLNAPGSILGGGASDASGTVPQPGAGMYSDDARLSPVSAAFSETADNGPDSGMADGGLGSAPTAVRPTAQPRHSNQEYAPASATVSTVREERQP